MASRRLTWRTLGKHTNTCNQTARNRKENGFNDQEGDSEQADLLGAKSSLAGRRHLDRRDDRKPRLNVRGHPESWNQFFSR